MDNFENELETLIQKYVSVPCTAKSVDDIALELMISAHALVSLKYTIKEETIKC